MHGIEKVKEKQIDISFNIIATAILLFLDFISELVTADFSQSTDYKTLFDVLEVSFVTKMSV